MSCQTPDAAVLLLVTATPAGETIGTAPPGAVLIAPPTPTYDFPKAVTATPALIAQTGPAVGSSTGGTGSAGQSVRAPTPVVVVPPAAAPLIDVNVLVPEAPTRRPTPTFDFTAVESQETPTVTPTVTPTYGPPIVIFKAKEPVIKPGKCTEVFWNVRNVLEVYYEGLGVPGEGSKEECIDDDGDVLSLLVVLPSGVTEEYTTTITALLPTPTFTPPPTFTPIPVYTPTWTPQPPPTTPTLVVTYGVELGVVGGSRQQCAIGSTCTIGLSMTNLGSQPDDLAVETVETGPWSSQICRTDGVCSAGTITLYNVGPGNSGTVNLTLSIPGDIEAADGNLQRACLQRQDGPCRPFRSDPDRDPGPIIHVHSDHVRSSDTANCYQCPLCGGRVFDRQRQTPAPGADGRRRRPACRLHALRG